LVSAGGDYASFIHLIKRNPRASSCSCRGTREHQIDFVLAPGMREL
jgi:hypothetical protein